MIPTDPNVARRLFCYVRWLEEIYGPAEGWTLKARPGFLPSGFAWCLTDSDGLEDVAFRLVLRSRILPSAHVGVAPGTNLWALPSGNGCVDELDEPATGIVLEVRCYDDFLASSLWVYCPGHHDEPPDFTSEAGVAWIRAKAFGVRRLAEVRGHPL